MPVLAPRSAPSAVDVVVVRAAVERAGRVLLVRRAAWDTLPGAWELPGGKVDPAESHARALARELAEETALSAVTAPDPWFSLPLHSPSGRSVLELVYRVRATGAPELSGEHDALVWQDPRAAAAGPLTRSAAAALSASGERRETFVA